MFSFFKKKQEIPDFKEIKTYSQKDMYFVRTKNWTWVNKEQIALLEKSNNQKVKMITLEFWSQEMFLDADGEKTISEYLKVLIKQFQNDKMEVPPDLDVFMIETLTSLHKDLNAITFYNTSGQLQPEYKEPIKKIY